MSQDSQDRQPKTPLPRSNRPGLRTLRYRIGTHASFLYTMRARLTGFHLKRSPEELAANMRDDDNPLAELTNHNSDDPAIALMDSWALVADVLTFYQERIANEGYLPTATEYRSLVELARLVGYAPRPGVAASVWLALLLEQGHRLKVEAGLRARSEPGPGEQPQVFETIEPIEARFEWSELKPRLTRPPILNESIIELLHKNALTLYFVGLSTNLKPNDILILVFANAERGEIPIPAWVWSVEPELAENRTKVMLTTGAWTRDGQTLFGPSSNPLAAANYLPTAVLDVARQLGIKPNAQPRSAQALPRRLPSKDGHSGEAVELGMRALKALHPELSTLYTGLASASVTPPSLVKSIEPLRVHAPLFGNNAPQKPRQVISAEGSVETTYEEWALSIFDDLKVILLTRDTRIFAFDITLISGGVSFSRAGELQSADPFELRLGKGDHLRRIRVEPEDQSLRSIVITIEPTNADEFPPTMTLDVRWNIQAQAFDVRLQSIVNNEEFEVEFVLESGESRGSRRLLCAIVSQ